MASLKEAARSVLGDAQDAICWIAIWKTGRSWHAETFYETEYTESRNWPRKQEESWTIGDDDAERLTEITAEDPDARLVNGYYANLGPLEEMTLASLTDGLDFQYSLGGNIPEILRKAGR